MDAPPRLGDPGTYNRIWLNPATKVVPTRRTSLIVDPPDGRLPFTGEGRSHYARSAARYGVGPRDSSVGLDTGERCLTDGLPLPYWTGYNNNYQVFQTRDYVVILAEMFRDRRIIPVDARSHGTVPQWLGDPRGRWEGDTLVVETTSFVDKAHYWWATAWRAARPTLRLTERFTRVDSPKRSITNSRWMMRRCLRGRGRRRSAHDESGLARRDGRSAVRSACHEGNNGLAETS